MYARASYRRWQGPVLGCSDVFLYFQFPKLFTHPLIVKLGPQQLKVVFKIEIYPIIPGGNFCHFYLKWCL
jgi:hypothetical protein